MDAQCNGCGGRVMPYHQYIVHFRPTATCTVCGRRVRLRGYTPFVASALTFFVVILILLRNADSVGLWIAVGAALLLLALLGDFWTFKNLSWDPLPTGDEGLGSPQPSGTASRVTRSQ